jgi:hypothetical protein
VLHFGAAAADGKAGEVDLAFEAQSPAEHLDGIATRLVQP